MNQKRICSVFILCTVLFIFFIFGYMLGKGTSRQMPYIYENHNTTISESTQVPYDDLKIDINSATVDELVLLDGIGSSLAQRIIDYRTENGPFKQIEDIMNVRGIGTAKFEMISDHITIGG